MTQYVVSIYYIDQAYETYYQLPSESGEKILAKDLIVTDLSITRDFVVFKYNGKSCYVVNCKLIAKEI
ncbi:hypothetical protein Ah1_00154 [Aeromonas phage Ah1]|uniref:Uncharacterized protein n=1 Tax=Aeromonas phage Ah1 TaxID=2053701 RepID=A0A2H4YFE2_9CAUD|nr:hypothetical protein KNT77_gp154 [Aeromonas phage Ah1]AUE22695.1 hypothetical protein Ah1_00154 [Aeromonas phage Ah1]UYD60241.1 hypothetical protein OPFAMLBM_00242 [Aeromonas phage avDM12-TAAL]